MESDKRGNIMVFSHVREQISSICSIITLPKKIQIVWDYDDLHPLKKVKLCKINPDAWSKPIGLGEVNKYQNNYPVCVYRKVCTVLAFSRKDWFWGFLHRIDEG